MSSARSSRSSGQTADNALNFCGARGWWNRCVVVGASATEGAKVAEGEAVVAGITTRTPGGKHIHRRDTARLGSGSISLEQRFGWIDARSAINNQESPARTTYVDPQEWVDGADVVSVLCAITRVSPFTIVATSAFTPRLGSLSRSLTLNYPISMAAPLRALRFL